MEKVRNFLRNYLESEKFFSKFSYFLGRENFQHSEHRLLNNLKIFDDDTQSSYYRD